MKARNIVVEGDYKGKAVVATATGKALVVTGFGKSFPLNRETVAEYDVMDSNQRTSGSSAVTRAAVGSFFLGPAGLLMGTTAKKKSIHLIAIQFYNGQRSLVEVDDKVYKAIMQSVF